VRCLSGEPGAEARVLTGHDRPRLFVICEVKIRKLSIKEKTKIHYLAFCIYPAQYRRRELASVSAE
jgi:hypothetical protein